MQRQHSKSVIEWYGDIRGILCWVSYGISVSEIHEGEPKLRFNKQVTKAVKCSL